MNAKDFFILVMKMREQQKMIREGKFDALMGKLDLKLDTEKQVDEVIEKYKDKL